MPPKAELFCFYAKATPNRQSAAHSPGICPRLRLNRHVQHLLPSAPHTKSLPYTCALLINEPHTVNCSFQEAKSPNVTHPSFTLSISKTLSQESKQSPSSAWKLQPYLTRLLPPFQTPVPIARSSHRSAASIPAGQTERLSQRSAPSRGRQLCVTALSKSAPTKRRTGNRSGDTSGKLSAKMP